MFQSEFYKQYGLRSLPQNDLEALARIAQGDEKKFNLLTERRLYGEPLAYIQGEASFFGLKFKVDRRVYVPNPETEIMVEGLIKKIALEGLKKIHNPFKNFNVLDIGTGCGNIAIVLAKISSLSHRLNIYATDIDPNALKLARENVVNHGANISFFEERYVDDLDIPCPDFIISDLPYGDKNSLLDSINVLEFKHMPPIACHHLNGSLNAYEELIESIQKRNWKTKLFFETGKIKKDDVKQIIPRGIRWKYVEFQNYSYTVLDFKPSKILQ